MRGLDQTSVELARGKPEAWVLAHLSFDVCGRPRLPGVELKGTLGWDCRDGVRRSFSFL